MYDDVESRVLRLQLRQLREQADKIAVGGAPAPVNRLIQVTGSASWELGEDVTIWAEVPAYGRAPVDEDTALTYQRAAKDEGWTVHVVAVPGGGFRLRLRLTLPKT